MKQTETEKTLQADPELDAVLEQMADEVPPMPADFHDKWMSAIRAEAKQETPAAEDRKEKKIVSMNRWTRILSVAAAFVFLIGGTVLYWRAKYYDADEECLDFDMTPAVMTAAPETASEETVYAEAAGAVKTEGTVNNVSAAKEASSAAKSASNAEEPAVYDMEPMMAMDAAMEDTAEESAAGYEAAAEYEAAEMPAAEPVATASPTAVVTALPESQETDERLDRVKEFVADMGEFLLAALPYLLVLAVPAAAALVIRYRKKGKKE